MLQERLTAIQEELTEVESVQELNAIWCDWQVECIEDPLLTLFVKSTVCRLRLFGHEPATQTQPPVQADQAVQAVQSVQPVQQEKTPVTRSRTTKKYKLMSTEVGWTSKPQVQAIAAILAAHAAPGDVLDESDIIRMMVANEDVLKTRQGGEKVWKYYRGDHAEGLEAHGNIVEVK
jgi:hypothetical protein